jgi:hypothetical protein
LSEITTAVALLATTVSVVEAPVAIDAGLAAIVTVTPDEPGPVGPATAEVPVAQEQRVSAAIGAIKNKRVVAVDCKGERRIRIMSDSLRESPERIDFR